MACKNLIYSCLVVYLVVVCLVFVFDSTESLVLQYSVCCCNILCVCEGGAGHMYGAAAHAVVCMWPASELFGALNFLLIAADAR